AADLVLIDYRKLSVPYLDEEISLVDAIIQRAKSAMVNTVMIAGRVVYDSPRFLAVDRSSVIAELADQLNRPRSQAEAARRKLARDVLPYVTNFYSDYPKP